MDTIQNTVDEIWIPLDPKRGLEVMSMQQNKIVSEEDILGLHFTEAVE